MRLHPSPKHRIRDVRIIDIGTAASLNDYEVAGTRTIHLAGHFLAPGLIDVHTHFIRGGFQLGSVDLRSPATPAEFTCELRRCPHSAGNRWITAGD